MTDTRSEQVPLDAMTKVARMAIGCLSDWEEPDSPTLARIRDEFATALASQHTPSEEAKPSEVEAFSNLDRLCDLARSCNQVSALDREIDSLEASLRAVLEAKPTTATEVTDEAVVHEPGCGRVSMSVEKWQAIEAALTRTGDLQAENKKFRIMFDAMDKDARRPSVVLVERVFDLQAENERLLGVVDGMADDVAAYSELQYALADPAFVRVPREVLEHAGDPYAEHFARRLLREYGGTE